MVCSNQPTDGGRPSGLSSDDGAANVSTLRASIPDALGALRDIAVERQRQIESEGWSLEHDDAHIGGDLAAAAGCYALHFASRAVGERISPPHKEWPWCTSWWKPSDDPRRDLIKSAALIVAEIERLDRAEGAKE